LEAGLDVLVEKPLALTAREARELNRAARVRELKLCVFQNYRFRPSVLRVQRLLKEGALGRLSQVTAVSRGDDPFAKRASWSWDGTADKLLLYELGIHYIDLAIQFAGPIKEITGFQSAVSPELGATTQIRALTRHESGAAGVIDFQVLAASNFVRLEVLGSEQDVLIKFFPEVFRLHRGWVTPLVELRSDSRRIWDFVVPKMWEKVRKPEVSRRLLPHFLIVKGFLESLEHPELDPPVTAESILPTLDALDVLHAHACEEQKKHISPV
jgi:predicted dehydrogenase